MSEPCRPAGLSCSVHVDNFPIAPRKILLHAPAGSHLTTIRRGTLLGEKFSKFFLSALAGQVVDVGASRAGGLTRRRVDVDSPIGRLRPRDNWVAALRSDRRKKKSEIFSKSRGRPSSRCRSISGRRVDTAEGRCRLARDSKRSSRRGGNLPVAERLAAAAAPFQGQCRRLSDRSTSEKEAPSRREPASDGSG